MSDTQAIVKLETRIVDKPWGRRGIHPRFGVDAARQVGEIWFEPPAGQPLDVMAKYGAVRLTRTNL